MPPLSTPRDVDYWFGTWKEHSRRLLNSLSGLKDGVKMDGGSVDSKTCGGRASILELERTNRRESWPAMAFPPLPQTRANLNRRSPTTLVRRGRQTGS